MNSRMAALLVWLDESVDIMAGILIRLRLTVAGTFRIQRGSIAELDPWVAHAGPVGNRVTQA